jgi:hypothetical protein
VKLEEQVVSLELAKELEETGYPQEGLWWWNENKGLNPIIENRKGKLGEWFVAPTVAEILNSLPDRSRTKEELKPDNLAKEWLNGR